jgi:alcohol dehydrogenase, propanol-preferring
MEAPEGSASVTFPFTLGHENAGWVEKLGPGVAGYAVGDPVLVYGPWGCGRCLNFRTGTENYCQNEGMERPGGGSQWRDGQLSGRSVNAFSDSYR